MGKRKPDEGGFTTEVTHLGKGRYGCRVLKNGILHSEALALSKSEIRPCLQDLLRFVSKLGETSPMADASRFRQKGKVK